MCDKVAQAYVLLLLHSLSYLQGRWEIYRIGGALFISKLQINLEDLVILCGLLRKSELECIF